MGSSKKGNSITTTTTMAPAYRTFAEKRLVNDMGMPTGGAPVDTKMMYSNGKALYFEDLVISQYIF